MTSSDPCGGKFPEAPRLILYLSGSSDVCFIDQHYSLTLKCMFLEAKNTAHYFQ